MAGDHYICKKCGHFIFILFYVRCPVCDAPLLQLDKHMIRIPPNHSMEEYCK